jgi:hypothetical protein
MPKRVTKKAAVAITTDIDRIATLLQNDHVALEIPKDVALDAAKRLDLISDHIEKVAEHFDAGTIGEEKKGPLSVEDKSDDMPGEFTQEEFASVEQEARNRQAPLPKSAQEEKEAALPISNIHDLETRMAPDATQMVADPDDYLPGEFTNEEFSSVREIAEEGMPGPGISCPPMMGRGRAARRRNRPARNRRRGARR